MTYLIDGTLGAKLDRTDVSASQTIGTRKYGNESSEWMYIQAASAIPAFSAVMINQSSKAINLLTANSASSRAVGFAQVSVASGSFSWVALQGSNIKAKLLVDCAPNVNLYTTATPGELDDASVADGLVAGVVATVTISNATAVRIIAYNPHVTKGGTA